MDAFEHVVLCVDDEENILNALKRLLRREGYKLLTASSAIEALKLLKENDVHIVISDERMPEMRGTEFLAQVRDQYPDVLRICLTGYTEVDSITESINKGHIYKFFHKPWNDQSLKLEIKQALDQYDLIQANKNLHRKVIEQNEELKRINENLEKLVQERTRELEFRNQALELSHAIFEDLPVSVIGVGADGMIALVNRKSESLTFVQKPLEVGKYFSEYFPDDLVEHLEHSLKNMTPEAVIDYALHGNRYTIEFIPLSGRFHKRGILVASYLAHYSPSYGKIK